MGAATPPRLWSAAGADDGEEARVLLGLVFRGNDERPRLLVERGRRPARGLEQLREGLVRDGAVWTSAGIAAGIDLALRVVAEVCGEGVARATAAHMEYPYPEGNDRRVPT